MVQPEDTGMPDVLIGKADSCLMVLGSTCDIADFDVLARQGIIGGRCGATGHAPPVSRERQRCRERARGALDCDVRRDDVLGTPDPWPYDDDACAGLALCNMPRIEADGSRKPAAVQRGGPAQMRELWLASHRMMAGHRLLTIDLPVWLPKQRELARKLA